MSAILRVRKPDGTIIEIPAIKGNPGERGVGIADLYQMSESKDDGGENIFIFKLTNGATEGYVVRNGSKGSPGYTPQKGVDYNTEADKQEMVAAVLAALPAAEEVSF